MQFINLNLKNIKIAVVDSFSDDKDNDCIFELVICRNKLKELILSLFPFLNQEIENRNPLTKRELEVLSLLSRGKNNSEIAQILKISNHTSKAHVQNILQKMSVQGRTEAVVKAIKCRILNI